MTESSVSKPKRYKETGFVKYLLDDEFKRIERYVMVHCRSWPVRMCLQLQMYLGLRIGEVVRIKRRDFNEDFSKLRVILLKRKTKNVHERSIPEFLQVRLQYYDVKNVQYYQEGFMFHTQYGMMRNNAHIQKTTIQMFFTKMRRDLGLMDVYHTRQDGKPLYRISPHTLRHYACYRFYKASGKDIDVVKHVIGHKESATTAKYISSIESKHKEKKVVEDAWK